MTKNAPLLPPTNLVITIISATNARTNSVSQMLRRTIATNTAITVTMDEKICGTLCANICRSVSVSLVYRLMMSPLAWVSKKRTGSVCIWENISSRMVSEYPVPPRP